MTCFSLCREPPVMKLQDEAHATKGITFLYEIGIRTHCDNGKPRRSEINFLWPKDVGNFKRFPFQFTSFQVAEPSQCEYTIDIHASAGCPA